MILTKPYDRQRAVTYAETWALRRNPLFLNFAGRGGDCTNFTSQCLLAGCCTMDFTPDFGWYYVSTDNRAPAWTSVDFFYDFLTGAPAFVAENGGIGPFGREVRARELAVGDFVQLADGTGNFYHSLTITGFEPNDILVCAHTDDALNRRLSTYNFATLRFIHVEGVRVEVDDGVCYENLLAGISIGVTPPEDFLPDGGTPPMPAPPPMPPTVI